ncbi:MULTISPECIES: MFS transporter [Microbacterium]|uniref:MFS transporter n=1 Tax=Microbacterium TaxID=33882 RepID=UPI0021A4DE8D|nr:MULTISPECIES: MFS transporter [Microbacterium]MCT1376431.1 MFS transporter [Microbacterium sp. p3-SID337]MCZ0711398.1 MFS transporter [Microbacterium paraoxydans]MDH5134652.1 MFS transporter [Microbacterium sp. RD10]MDH5138192.1 MFS transporter [Microbacterium sp. RD11]MDH5146209.1 MFS transporter [Microbacterium sp. RD12]
MTRTAPAPVKTSWLPMVSLFLAQVLMSFNVAALPISLGGMVADFGVPPTIASTTIVMYGLAVAALVMTGAKLGQRVGWVLIFRVVVALFAGSAVMMLLAPTVWWAIAGQAVAGAAAAIIVPSIVALIAENYRGPQQATAIGAIGSARAISGVSAFLIGGTLGTLVGWRPLFVIVLAIAVAVFALSFTLRGDRGDAAIRIDLVAALLIGAAIVLLTLGFNNLNSWGALAAAPSAPFSVLGLSPAPIFIVLGIILGQGFFLWTRRRMAEGKVPLIDLTVLGSSRERAAVYAMFIVVALEACVNFTVPLYIQIVQGRTPFDTALAMMPFNLTVFITATLVVRFYRRYPPRTIGVFGFILTTAALVWLSVVVTNNWETVPTIAGLVVFGIGQGALVTLVFNVLVTAAPPELAGDVGSLRGTTQNLASAVGTALAGALLVSLLALNVGRAVVEHPELPPSLVSQVDLNEVNFISNDELRAVLETTDATPEQVDAAVAVNEESRLRTLKLGLLILAAVSALAILPASRLPQYRPHEIPDPSPTGPGE